MFITFLETSANVRNVLLVINKALSTMNLDLLRKKVEETYETPVAGVFPLSEDIAALASEGVFCVNYPDHAIAQEFKAVAHRIME